MTAEMATQDWSVRPYQHGDEAGVAALVHTVYGRPLDIDRYRWKLLGVSVPYPAVWLAVDGTRIVGQYACSPMRFKLGAREVPAAHVCDAMTAPDYRRRGVFTALGQAAHAAWSAAGLPFISGVPGDLGSALDAIGWRRLYRLRWLRRPLRLDALFARRYRLPAAAAGTLRAAGKLWDTAWNAAVRPDPAVRVREVSTAGVEFDELWSRVGAAHEFSVVRDRAWVAYRFCASPGYAYRLLLAERDECAQGYASLRLAERGSGVLADLFAAPGDRAVQRALLARALDTLRAMGAAEVRVLVGEGGDLERLFLGAGFLHVRGAFTVRVVPLAESLPLGALRDTRRWFATGGDYDVV